MKSTHGEAANSIADVAAMVARTGALREMAKAEGTYTVKSVGPREHDRERYVGLRDKLTKHDQRHPFMRAVLNPFVRKARSDFDAIPLEDKWEDTVENLVTTVGKNYALDLILAASAYTVVGPFMGLINTNASAAAGGDTMASHAGWLEVGTTNLPSYTAPRKTITFSAASAGAKASTGTYTFAITGSGTVGGCFLVLHTGALSTIDNTAGTLYSAGAFTGGSKTVASGDSLTVTYTASL